MKINVIFTGGTIGSAFHGGYISPDPAMKYRLISNYKEKFGESVEFDAQNPYTILSENLSGVILNTLVSSVKKALKSDCDGIIIAHGTDTLQYSACAVAYCVGSETKPIVFVSANYPLENPISNGNINFEAAVEFIKQSGGKGVYVSYSNDLKSADIHFATRLLRHGEYDHKLFSLVGPYATYKDGVIISNVNFVNKEDISPLSENEFSNTSGILNITVSPFEQYNYSLNGIRAVVFTPYHSGTLNTDSAEFKDFCEKAAEMSVPLYVTGVTKGGEYQSMEVYSDLQIIPVYNTTSIALIVKLWLNGKL